MKLEKYIKESIVIGNTTYSEKDIKNFLKWWHEGVEKKCKPFLKELKYRNEKEMNMLYRGSNRSKDIGKKKVRKDRIPKDMPYDAHDALDTAFDNIYGWRARSEGLFCTGRQRTAATYGSSQIIFPIGKFRYLWSDNIHDLYSYTDDGANVAGGPTEDDEYDWRREWEDEYGENGYGYWTWEGTQLDNDKDTSIDMMRDDERDSVQSEIDYEEEQEEPDEEEIERLKDRLEYIDSRDYGYDIGSELVWEPETDLEDFMDSKREDFEDSGGDIDVAERIIQGEYDDKNLQKALRHPNGTEIMVQCDEYYFFHKYYYDLITKVLFDTDYDPRQESFGFMKDMYEGIEL